MKNLGLSFGLDVNLLCEHEHIILSPRTQFSNPKVASQRVWPKESQSWYFGGSTGSPRQPVNK